MKRQILQTSLALLFTMILVGEACAFLEPASQRIEPREISVDIWVEEETGDHPVRVRLFIGAGGELAPGPGLAVLTPNSADPWWSDKVILQRTQRGMEIVRSMTRIVWKIAIRVVPIPAIY